MKIDQYCQRQRCKQLNVLFDIVFLAFICRIDFFAEGLHTRTAVAYLSVSYRLSCVSLRVAIDNPMTVMAECRQKIP